MHAFRLDGDQGGIISARTVVVIAPVERIGHDRGASTPRKAQAGVGVLGNGPLQRNLEAVCQSVQFFPDIRRVGAKCGLRVFQDEAERLLPLAPVKSGSARGFQKAFGHLLADVIGASSALQHVHSPWLDHLQSLFRTRLIAAGGFHARKILRATCLVKRATSMTVELRAAFTAAGAASTLAEIANLSRVRPRQSLHRDVRHLDDLGQPFEVGLHQLRQFIQLHRLPRNIGV